MCFAIADSLTVLILTYCSTTLLHFYTALAAIPEFHIFKKMYTDSQIDSKVTKIILYTKKNKTKHLLFSSTSWRKEVCCKGVGETGQDQAASCILSL